MTTPLTPAVPQTPPNKINLFLSAVSTEFQTEREALASQLRKHHFVREQKDFEQGPGTLLQKLEAYIRDECHAVIFLTGKRYGAEPPAVEAAPALDGLPKRYSYTQWEYLFATRHNKARFVFVPAADYPVTAASKAHPPEDPARAALQTVFIDEYIRKAGKDRSPFHSLDDLKDQVRALRLEALHYARASHLPLKTDPPYVGLRRFEERDREHFYGRDGLLDEFLPVVQREPLLLVTGHSGSGKSSLLRAGLIPRWRKIYGDDAPVILFHPDDDPFESLCDGLHEVAEKSERTWVRDGHADVFTELLRRIPGLQGKTPLVIVDQFEEIFTRVPEAARARADQFVAALVAAQRDGSCRIILAMRDDFYGNLERHPTLCQLLDTGERTRRILRPTESELRAIIEAPALSHGVGFESDLIDRIIREVRGQRADPGEERRGLLPLLEFTLRKLWEYEVDTRSIEDRVLNVRSYEQIGGFSGALRKHTDAFYESLDAAQQGEVQRIFLQLIQFGETDIPVSRSVPRTALLQNADPKLLDRLISREKLLISGEDNVELAHEALIRGWGQFEQWIRDNQEAIRLHRRLEEDATNWITARRGKTGAEPGGEGYLWRGINLELAETAHATGEFERVGDLSREAREFLLASRQAMLDEIAHLRDLVTRAEAGEAEALANEQRALAGEAAAEAGRKRSQRRAAVAIVFALFAIAGMLGAAWFYREAESERRISEAARNAAEHAFESAFGSLENLNSAYSAKVIDNLKGLQASQAQELKVSLNDELIDQLEILHGERPEHTGTVRMLVDLNVKNCRLFASKESGDRCESYIEAAKSWSEKLQSDTREDAELLSHVLVWEPIGLFYAGTPSKRSLEIAQKNHPRLKGLIDQWPDSWLLKSQMARLENAIILDEGSDPGRLLKVAQGLAPVVEQSGWDYDVILLRVLAWTNSIISRDDKSLTALSEVAELLAFFEKCFQGQRGYSVRELDQMAGGRLKSFITGVLAPVLSAHDGKNNKEAYLDLLNRTQELIHLFARQLPRSGAVYEMKGEFLVVEQSLLSKHGIGLRSGESILSSIERHRIEAASHGVAESISQLFAEVLATYEETADEETKSRVIEKVRDSAENLLALDFVGLNSVLNEQSLTSKISSLRKKAPEDPIIGLHEKLLVQLDTRFRQSGISVRRQYFEDYSRTTIALPEKLLRDGDAPLVADQWREATAGIDPFLLKDGERTNTLEFARHAALACVESGDMEEALKIGREGTAFSEEILEIRPWDWYLRESFLKLNFDLAAALKKVGRETESQVLLHSAWETVMEMYGETIDLGKFAVLPLKGTVPDDADEGEASFFNLFKTKGNRDSSSEMIVISCDVNGEKVPVQFYLLAGRNGYLGLQHQFRWIKEFRGVDVPDGTESKIKEALDIAKAKGLPASFVLQFAVSNSGGDVEDFADQWDTFTSKTIIPSEKIDKNLSDSVVKLWVIAKENNVSFVDLCTYALNFEVENEKKSD